ncbi:MAG: exodeoxyribonuclease V subunit gamma [Dokdonella sp.]
MPESIMTSGATGLFVHRGSRIERLAEELACRLDAESPGNPLTPQTIVVAHAGLGRWLLGEFSRRVTGRSGHAIAANFDMILPWQWLDRIARETLGDAALIGGPWRREVLRWRILAALPLVDAPQIRAYSKGDAAARRSFQLAGHLAGVYTQYLVYRPELIEAWERSASAPANDWQAALWRRVQSAVGKPHRAQRREALLHALAGAVGPANGKASTPPDDTSGECVPLHVFGVSHLAPDVLDALRATALQRPVHVYFPDPCREHWSYLRSRRELLRSEEDPLALYFEVGHPLLVALARVAQDFCLALDEMDAIDERDPLDEVEPENADVSLLESVQSSIRCMQPDRVGEAFRAELALVAAEDRRTQRATQLRALRDCDDASLRVYACHTRLRELEVLRDALLRALADNPSLQHRDIVVMAPDITAYAPYLAAVFGAPARYRSDPLHVPWHLADVGMASLHPLMTAFDHLLDLAESRFKVSDVLGLLDVAPLARRFAIDEPAREILERWLRRARVAWGLDGAMKEQVGAAHVEANSWQFGLDRLYAGLIVGHDGADETLDGILPLAGVGGGAVDALGQLDRLLGQLRHMRSGLGNPRTLGEWSAWLGDRLDALFLIDPRDDAENAAMDALRRMLGDLAAQAVEANVNAAQPWSIVREVLREALQAVPERQPFLLGGVTFCGLVPQRSIPFRMICLLGMNEGQFPRGSSDVGLNLMRTHPRRGDRDTRNEDRYLFLEALMAARSRLHISYIGIGVRDGKPRNPSSVLAELLQFLDEQHDIALGDEVERPWKIMHPLQPFDARYYERDPRGEPLHDPRLFSYDATFLACTGDALPAAGRFIAREAATVDGAANGSATGEISLDALKRFWRDPAKYVLQRGVGIGLDALDAQAWPDREPLETSIAPLDRFDRRLLLDALEKGCPALPPMLPAWLAQSGVLAAGSLGERAYAEALEGATALLTAARDHFPQGRAERAAQAIDIDLGDGVRLGGNIAGVFRAHDDRLLLFDAKPGGRAGFREWLPFFIDWAALRLTFGDRVSATFIECAGEKHTPKAALPALLAVVTAQDDATIRRGLRSLIGLFAHARSQPLLFFPATAWQYAIADPQSRIEKAKAQWQGNGEFSHPSERDYSPGYAGLLTRGIELFDTQTADHAAFVAIVERVCAVLDPSHEVLMRETQTARSAIDLHDAPVTRGDSW